MHVHRDIPIDIDQVITMFSRWHKTRMRVANILADEYKLQVSVAVELNISG